MYCKNCGKQIGVGDLCKDCEALLGTTVVNNGEKFDVVKEVNNINNKITYSDDENTNTNYANNNYTTSTNQYSNQRRISSKSKVAAGVFGLLLGAFGVHNFYLGYTGKAIAQVLITVLSCGALSFVSAIWGLIEGILILTGGMPDADGNELRD